MVLSLLLTVFTANTFAQNTLQCTQNSHSHLPQQPHDDLVWEQWQRRCTFHGSFAQAYAAYITQSTDFAGLQKTLPEKNFRQQNGTLTLNVERNNRRIKLQAINDEYGQYTQVVLTLQGQRVHIEETVRQASGNMENGQ